MRALVASAAPAWAAMATATTMRSCGTGKPRVGHEDESSEHPPCVVGRKIDLLAGKAHRRDAPQKAAVHDTAVRQDRRPVRSGHAALISTSPKVKKVRELRRRSVGHGNRRLSCGNHLTELVDQFHVVGFLECDPPVMPPARRELRDYESDHEQADSRLEIGTMAYGKSFVGAREEEVKGQARGRRGKDSCHTRPRDGNSGDDGDEDQRSCRSCQRSPCRDQ